MLLGVTGELKAASLSWVRSWVGVWRLDWCRDLRAERGVRDRGEKRPATGEAGMWGRVGVAGERSRARSSRLVTPSSRGAALEGVVSIPATVLIGVLNTKSGLLEEEGKVGDVWGFPP